MENNAKPKKSNPPTIGLAAAADFWLWGAIFLYLPSYFEITSGWQYFFTILGYIALIISFAGALVELGKLWQSEGLGFWGASLVFLIPSISLYFAVEFQRITGTIVNVAKIGATILLMIGGPLFFHGIPYFFWKKDTEGQKATQPTTAMNQVGSKELRKFNLEAMSSIIVALLALATAVVTLVEKIVP